VAHATETPPSALRPEENLERILLVEDDPDIRLIASTALEGLGGFAVATAGSGREALELAPGFAPDLILLDIMLPEMDGPTTLLALREIPALEATPVIFLTARVFSSDLEQYKLLGALAVIGKPFDPLTLAEEIERLWRARP
jgi:two-component system, OmpR family, response regulator